jgi:hypothetical protein
MALRLSRSLNVERRIEVGYGVIFRIRAFSFAEYKEVEAAAHRMARETLSPGIAIELEAVDDEDLKPEVDDAMRGRFAQTLTLLLLLRFGTGWGGVEIDDDKSAPFERQSIEMFLDQFPGVAIVLQQQLLLPFQTIAAEGKGSAPLPDTGTPEA